MHPGRVQNIYGEPTPRFDARQFGSGGASGGGTTGTLQAELTTEDGSTLLETESGKAIATEQ